MASGPKRKPTKPSRDKVREHRERLREQGLRPVQFWVLDVRSKEFRREARRQSLLANASPHAKEDQDWVDSMAAIWEIEDE